MVVCHGTWSLLVVVFNFCTVGNSYATIGVKGSDQPTVDSVSNGRLSLRSVI